MKTKNFINQAIEEIRNIVGKNKAIEYI